MQVGDDCIGCHFNACWRSACAFGVTWKIDGRTVERAIFGPERPNQKPVIVDRAELAARYTQGARQFDQPSRKATYGELQKVIRNDLAILPLTAVEIALIPALVATRMLTTLAITSTRAARYPENAPYILRNFPSARDGLLALSRLDPTDTETALRRACGME